MICVTALLGLSLALLTGAAAEDQKQVPYDLEKFRPVLDASKLQAPTSSPTKIAHGKFKGESNEYFHLDPTGRYMVFTVTGGGNRSELRQMSGEWKTSTKTERRLSARLKVFVPGDDSLNQITFMQVHDMPDKEAGVGLNKPLIRLTWRRSRGGKKDRLWAALRVPADPSKPVSLDNLDAEWVDLGPRPRGLFNAEIRVRNNRLTVVINGRAKLTKDVTYWAGLNNYFKAGVYNQESGTSKVYFEQLVFHDGDEPSDTPEGKEQ